LPHRVGTCATLAVKAIEEGKICSCRLSWLVMRAAVMTLEEVVVVFSRESFARGDPLNTHNTDPNHGPMRA
jgi:hypothetical protein